jgi:hypothetical protein
MSPITDVRSPSGWIQLYGVRVAKAVYIGTTSLLALLYVTGILRVNGRVDFAQTGTATGVVLSLNDVTQLQILTIPCTNTGGAVQISNGGAKYDTCIGASPLTTTGAITAITLACGSVPRPFAYDVSFVKTRQTGTGVALKNLSNLSTGTGVSAHFGTGYTLWNPADLLKLGTLTSVPTTSGNNCQLRVVLHDKYGT